MADLTDIIQSAVTEATGSDDSTDSSSDDSSTEETATPETGTVVPEAGTETPAEEPAAEVDDVTKELEELGLKAPEKGAKENRIPYSRVKKITDNLRKKLTAEREAAIQEREAKLTKAEERLRSMDTVDRLIASNPDQYLGMLATLHPNLYKKYVSGQVTPTEVKQVQQAVQQEEAPQPDAQYADGSVGYSAAGLQKLLEWQSRQTEARVTSRVEESYNKRFGPIEQNWRAQQAINEKIPVVRNQIEQAKQTWGKLFEDDYKKDKDSEVLKVLQQNPEMSFDTAVAKVMLPKLQAERNSMRAEILKEINARPKAAVKAAPAAAVAGAEASGPRSMEDIIRESIASLK